MYYKWTQAGNVGIVEAKGIRQAEKLARESAPYNPSQFQVTVSRATDKDLSWLVGFGGIVRK